MENKLPPLIQHLADAIDKKGMIIKFGLEQQGHISSIEEILEDLGSNDYSWKKISDKIGWEKNAAMNSYIDYLRSKNSKILSDLVDITWGSANEDNSVPSISLSKELIEKAISKNK